MNVVCVVQARMGSTRLPGKVLADVCGRPMLALMLDRLNAGDAGDVGQVVLATSTSPVDDPVAALAATEGVMVVRGSEADVLARFADAVGAVPADVVVRLTADCPLIDPAVVRQAVAHHVATDADYTSNTLVRTYPDGLDVEVVRADVLLEAERQATDPAEREHVTPFVYRRPERYTLAAIRHDDPAAEERWTVDTAEDLRWLRATVSRLGDRVATAGWLEVLELVGRRHGLDDDTVHLRPAATSEPAARVWQVHRGASVLGTMRVPVRDGVGVLEADVPAGLYGTAVALLRDALRADYQLRELRLPAPPAG